MDDDTAHDPINKIKEKLANGIQLTDFTLKSNDFNCIYTPNVIRPNGLSNVEIIFKN